MQNLWSIHSRPTELESTLKKKNPQIICMWFRALGLHFCHRIDDFHTSQFEIPVPCGGS